MSQIKFEPIQISSFGDEALAALDASFRSKEVFEIGGKLFSLSGVSHHCTGAEIGRVSAVADHVSVPANPAWTGEGLPPVGTACEFTSNDGRNWRESSILFLDNQVVLLSGYELFKVADPDFRLRPIRTPEQIAKQARSKACDKMYGVILDKIPHDRRNNGSDICEALYDAGYRKFEIVDE